MVRLEGGVWYPFQTVEYTTVANKRALSRILRQIILSPTKQNSHQVERSRYISVESVPLLTGYICFYIQKQIIRKTLKTTMNLWRLGGLPSLGNLGRLGRFGKEAGFHFRFGGDNNGQEKEIEELHVKTV